MIAEPGSSTQVVQLSR